MILENTVYNGLIAPCGMNCGTCIGYLRMRNPCPGCLKSSATKPAHCVNCQIVNCEILVSNQFDFCFQCEKYPCKRLQNLDKRYRTRYQMSMLENLDSINSYGIEFFLENEKLRWKCPTCGSGLCVHRDNCLHCETKKSIVI